MDKLWHWRRRLDGMSGLLSHRMSMAVIVPVTMILAFRLFGETGLYVTALLAVPMHLLHRHLVDLFGGRRPRDWRVTARRDLAETLQQNISMSNNTGGSTACLIAGIDDFADIRERLGPLASDEIGNVLVQRISSVLRRDDYCATFGRGHFAVALSPGGGVDLEALLQLAARIQRITGDPISLRGAQIRVTLSVGFCHADRLGDPSGDALVDAAEAAMREAELHGPGAVRAYSRELHRKRTIRSQLTEDFEAALELGQITAHYQPQISTDTGHVTGFEALARWEHPERGMISPGEFLPAVEAACLEERLGEVMLTTALKAICAWDRAGQDVPSVGVNFSLAELRSPTLVDRIAWELDRYDLSPSRLTIEVLENVIADGAEDIVARNISGLANLGCSIDLDDFGTGHASLTNIRRFTVTRLKIDRSFVTRIQESREQQRLVSAIVTMAERLDLDTLAEGVETVGEHTMLAQLGCRHVQGFGIARPMPLGDTFAWLEAHNARIEDPPAIGRSRG